MKNSRNLPDPMRERRRLVDLPWHKFVQDYITRQAISGEFLDATLRLVKALTRDKPPSVYSPLRIWDREEQLENIEATYLWERRDGDAHRAIAVDVLTEQVEKGHLEKLYYANKSNQQIYFHFRNAVKWHLHGIADRHGARCLDLYQRVHSVLRHNQRFHYFQSIGGWGLSEWKDFDWKPLSEESLQERIEAVEIPLPCTYRKKRRVAPTDEEIEDLIEAFFKALSYPIPLNKLVQVASAHFDVYDTSECPLPVHKDPESGENGQPVEFPDERSGLEEIQAETKATIEKFVGKLNQRDLYLIDELFLNRKKLRELVRPGYSKSSASNDFRRLKALLSKLSLDERAKPLVEAIFEEVLDQMKETTHVPSKEKQRPGKAKYDPTKATTDRKEKVGGDPKAAIFGSA